jgi:hypothetical protein
MTKPTAEQTAFNEAWQAICDIAAKEKTGPLNELPGLYHIIAGKWQLWINGKQSPLITDGVTVQPFHAYVEHNGWPAGIMTPNSGEIAAGSLANVFTLRDALKARAAR